MYILLTTIYLVLIIEVNGLNKFSDDNRIYNPCQISSRKFFYPHRTDIHKYYQCDEFGHAFLRSCGKLVWDDLHLTCNWPSTVIHLPIQVVTTLTITQSTSSTQSTSTTVTPSFSLCKPINPCGEHGECVETSRLISKSLRRFACICSQNWFGQLCDRHIDALTTPTTVKLAQIKNLSSVSMQTGDDSKIILNNVIDHETNGERNRSEREKQTADSNLNKDINVPSNTKETKNKSYQMIS